MQRGNGRGNPKPSFSLFFPLLSSSSTHERARADREGDAEEAICNQMGKKKRGWLVGWFAAQARPVLTRKVFLAHRMGCNARLFSVKASPSSVSECASQRPPPPLPSLPRIKKNSSSSSLFPKRDLQSNGFLYFFLLPPSSPQQLFSGAVFRS